MSINRVNISGNLTRDPEYKYTQGGTSVLNFGVAVNDRVRDPQTGEWGDRANFVDCVIFGNRAESLSTILHKGMKVAVEGKLRWRQWETGGQKRSKLEVVVDEIEFMQPRDQRGQAQQPAQTYQQPPTYQQPAPAPAYAPQPAQTYQQPQQPQYAPQTAYQQPQATPAPQPAPQPAQQQLPTPQQPVDVYDEDIPF